MSTPPLLLPSDYLPRLTLPVLPAHALVNNAGAGCTGQRSSSNAKKQLKWIYHPGVDFSDKRTPCRSLGSPVFAAHSGVVVIASNVVAKSYGKTLAIHDPATGYLTFYAHLQSVSAQVGQTVREGQQVALLGDTPQPYAGAAHLHFEFSIHNIVCDCSVFIEGFRHAQASNPFYYRLQRATANPDTFIAQSHWLTGSIVMSHARDWLTSPNRAMTHSETNHFIRALKLKHPTYDLVTLQRLASASDPKAALASLKSGTALPSSATPQTGSLTQGSTQLVSHTVASDAPSADRVASFTAFAPSPSVAAGARAFLNKRSQTDAGRVLSLLDSMNAQSIAPLTRAALLSRIIGETGLKGRLPYSHNNWGGVHYASGLKNATPGPRLNDEGMVTFAHFASDAACVRWMLDGNFAMIWETAGASPTLSALLLAAAGYGSSTNMPYSNYNFLKDSSAYRPLMEYLGVAPGVTSSSDGLLGVLLHAGNCLAHAKRNLGRRLKCENEYAQLASSKQTATALVLCLNGHDRYWLTDVGNQCFRLTPVGTAYRQYPRGRAAAKTIKSFQDTVHWCDSNIAQHQNDIFLYHAGNAPAVTETTSDPQADLVLQAAKQRIIRADLSFLIKSVSSTAYQPKWSYDQVASASACSTMAVFAAQLKVPSLQSALGGAPPLPVRPASDTDRLEDTPDVESFTDLLIVDSDLLTSLKTLSSDDELVRRLQASPASRLGVFPTFQGVATESTDPGILHLPHPDMLNLLARLASNPLALNHAEVQAIRTFFVQLKNISQ